MLRRLQERVAPILRQIWRGVRWATPGQLDAGFASLATFTAGIFAVRELSTVGLGGYALLFSAFTVMSQIPAELVFNPSQILAVDLPVNQRLGMLAHSVPRGAVLAFLSSFAVPLGVLTIAAQIPTADLISLSVSASLLAVVSPLQDHIRTILHMAENSWVASAMSATNFLTTLGTVLALSSIAAVWAPFGALFLGNVLSLIVGGWWTLRRGVPAPVKPTFRELRWLGGWLLVTGISKTGLRYAITALLNVVAGVAALGYVEGARVVSQPINVLAQGLMAQVGPQITRAGASKDRVMARRWGRRFAVILSLAAIPYTVLTAWPWAINPLALIAPRAYVVPSLTAATLMVVLLAGFNRPQRMQLLGARHQKTVARTTIATGLLELGMIGTGIWIGAYAAPVAAGLATVATMVWFHRRLRIVYDTQVPGFQHPNDVAQPSPMVADDDLP
jgi:O-antigen/teichoic acid export membrane protein